MNKSLAQEKLFESLDKIGNVRIKSEIDTIGQQLTEIIKGNVEIRIDIEGQQVIFNVHIDYDDRYFGKSLKFDDMLQSSFHGYYFVDNFIDEIDYYYLSKIRRY